MREHIANPWTISIVSGKFQVSRLVLGKEQFNIVATSVPPICRFPAPNDMLGVNTYRGNAFVKGRFTVTPHNGSPFDRHRGEEMVAVRWATEGGADFTGLDAYNEFWCVTLRDPSDGIYLQANYPLAPGESVVIPNRTMERNVFVLEGTVTADGTEHSLFKHLRLSQAKDYTFTNMGTEDAFILYFYQVTPEEFMAAGEPGVPEESYRKIPILSSEFWS